MIRNIKIHFLKRHWNFKIYTTWLIDLLKTFYENWSLSVSYILKKFDGSNQMKMWCSLWYDPIILSPQVWYNTNNIGVKVLTIGTKNMPTFITRSFNYITNKNLWYTTIGWMIQFGIPTQVGMAIKRHKNESYYITMIKLWNSQKW